jgi:hypothetical protein
MYPFTPSSALVQIFGDDLFHREETIPILRELAGLHIKPFECVATTEEIVAALNLAIGKLKASGESLPPVLEYAIRTIPGVTDYAGSSAILASYGPHRMPQEFERVLTNVLNSSPRSL